MARHPMTPAEWDAAKRELVRRCPFLWETSGYRGERHNADVGGLPTSKHLIGMAQDYGGPHEESLYQGLHAALKLRMWALVHDAGSGLHLHAQGLPQGPVPDWWSEKYL